MEPEGLLPHSQVPDTCTYPEPARSSPFPHILLPKIPSYYYPPIYAWVSQMDSFPQVSPPKPCIVCPLLHTRYMPHPSHSFRFYHPNNKKKKKKMIIIIIIILNNNNKRIWNVKSKVIPVIVGATGTISKLFRKYVSNIPGNHEVKELQKTAILGTTHILRKVLT